jgi:hypothetical protein
MNRSLKITLLASSIILASVFVASGGFAIWYFKAGQSTVKTDVVTSHITFSQETGSDTLGNFAITRTSSAYYFAIDQAARQGTGSGIPTTDGQGINIVDSLSRLTSDTYQTVPANDFTVTWTPTASTTAIPYGVFYLPTAMTNYVDVFVGSNTTALTPVSLTEYPEVASVTGLGTSYSAYPLSFASTSGSTDYTYKYNLTFAYKDGMNPADEAAYNVLKATAQDKNVGFSFGMISTGTAGSSVFTYDTVLQSDGTATITGLSSQAQGAYTTPRFTTFTKDGVTTYVPISSIAANAFVSTTWEITSITITGNIKTIGDSAFKGNNSLKSVILQEGVESIGANAFKDCPALATVTTPSTLKSISANAFSGANSLTTVTLSEGLTAIEDNAFYGCASLTSITTPSTLKSIGANAFKDNRSLTTVTLNEGLTSIGASAFINCQSLTTVTYPGSLVTFDPTLFTMGKLKSLTLNEGITTLGVNSGAVLNSPADLYLPSTIKSETLTNGGLAGHGWNETFHYNGTMAQWQSIVTTTTPGLNENLTVACTDGTINYSN